MPQKKEQSMKYYVNGQEMHFFIDAQDKELPEKYLAEVFAEHWYLTHGEEKDFPLELTIEGIEEPFTVCQYWEIPSYVASQKKEDTQDGTN